MTRWCACTNIITTFRCISWRGQLVVAATSTISMLLEADLSPEKQFPASVYCSTQNILQHQFTPAHQSANTLQSVCSHRIVVSRIWPIYLLRASQRIVGTTALYFVAIMFFTSRSFLLLDTYCNVRACWAALCHRQCWVSYFLKVTCYSYKLLHEKSNLLQLQVTSWKK